MQSSNILTWVGTIVAVTAAIILYLTTSSL